MIPVDLIFEDASCDGCGFRGHLLRGQPCPRCGARERRDPTPEERQAVETAKWTTPIRTADPPRPLPRTYIAVRNRTKRATQKRSEHHQDLVRRAHELDGQGMSRRRIAEVLDVTERTVYRLLRQEPGGKRIVYLAGHDISSGVGRPDLEDSPEPATLEAWERFARGRRPGGESED
jgi:hypothetical protein